LRFIQLDAPAVFKTVWGDTKQASQWRRSDWDILGRRPGDGAAGMDTSGVFGV